MQISVVIPTYERKARLLSLLGDLNRSTYPIAEVIIVDSGNDRIIPNEYQVFYELKIIYLRSQSSVCIQRNMGVRAATSPWVLVCDDDMEIPADHLQKLVGHVEAHPETGAVSGLVLQKDKEGWTGSYDISSAKELIIKYIFGLSIWGSITCSSHNAIIKKIKAYYLQKGNHIARSGWPVITDVEGEHFTVPVYGLCATLIRKSWLEASPYDEVLDRRGIGENYGVAIGFPAGIDIVRTAWVYNYQEPENRLEKPLQYYRRALALDYFIRTKSTDIPHVKRRWLLWSLFGNTLVSILTRDKIMIVPSVKTFLRIFWGRNPYYDGKKNLKVVEPYL